VFEERLAPSWTRVNINFNSLFPFFLFLYSSHWEIIRFGSSQSERGLQAQAAEKESQLFVKKRQNKMK
jgi:hypothetical protein